MKLKVILTFFMIWITFLGILLCFGRLDPQVETDKSFAQLLELELTQHPESVKDSLLNNNPQWQKLQLLMDRISRINNSMQNMMRSPAPIYCEEMYFEQQKYSTELQKLRQMIISILGQWEAIYSDTLKQNNFSKSLTI